MTTKKPYTSTQPVDDEKEQGEANTEGFDSVDQVSVASGEMEKSGRELERYIEDIADTVRIGLDQSIAILTPWFFNNMPQIYYQTTPRAEKVRHLSAVITGHVFESKQTVELWDRSRRKVTYIGPGGDRKILVEMASRLNNLELKMGSIYFSRDKLLFLSTFFCREFLPADAANSRILTKIEAARKLILQEFPDSSESVETYLQSLDNDFVVYATAARLQITYRMVHYMLNHEGAHTIVEPFDNSSTARLSVGFKNVELGSVLSQVMHLMNRYGFDIVRAFIIRFDEQLEESISVMHFVIQHESGQKVNGEHFSMIKLTKALQTLGWVDQDDYSQLMQEPTELSINAANLIRSLAIWVHVVLSKENVHYYSDHKIQETFSHNNQLTLGLVDLFRMKFDPHYEKQRSDDGYSKAKAGLKIEIDKVINRVERQIFGESLRFIDHLLKTNYYIMSKTGLAFRLSPDILDEKHYPQKPFGVFFVVGRHYRFFHVRWRDVARGGLRVVMPTNSADYSHALSGLFDEVYGLSHAQQMKNKDIPEGGSKAVLLLSPEGSRDRSVKGAINAMLDLLVDRDEAQEDIGTRMINYDSREEIIYLGPDENMSNNLIQWIPRQAERRGYKYARAFISSKPDDGINHKEYGVTSEGVHVYVDRVLKHLDIDPCKEKFTVKFTGGPDGDVAGNEMKILHREYGENARVVAIADGLGAAFDPKGLDWKELLSLVENNKSICEFNSAALSGEDAWVVKADSTESIRRRNNLHATAVSDIFIPAGGRPYTVKESNAKLFKNEEGQLTCRAIVEGANIFFTKEARVYIQQLGILMVKDSSANKTGVICSSFEIIASLILNQKEFEKIKEKYVAQVVEILREKAALEAELLFTEYVRHGKHQPLVDLSLEISHEINVIKDLLLEKFTDDADHVLADPLFQGLLLRYCPSILVEKYKDRILNELPKSHKIAVLAAFIASSVIYREGLQWLKGMGSSEKYRVITEYIRQDQHAGHLIDEIRSSNISSQDLVAMILRRSAARDLTMQTLQQSNKLKDS
ncbi:MAG: NAD-glutamate dehydrogenase domain-containing protein [Oligoflexales bacterium]